MVHPKLKKKKKNEVLETAKNHNQNHQDRTIRGKCKKLHTKYKNLINRQLIKYLINDLKNYGPTNVIHVTALSAIIGRPIRVWYSRGRLHRTIDNRMNKESIHNPIDIEYHDQAPTSIGHWTLLGSVDPINVDHDLNACLFAVISAQTGKAVDNLKANVIEFLTNNTKYLINQFDKFDGKQTELLIGGAQYNGTSPQDAGRILDNSQNVLCHSCRYSGHPRGHASDPSATGPQDSVENYSRTTGSMKSGFLSKTDQNNVAHLVLRNAQVQQAMHRLNQGSTSEAITLSRRDLQTNGNNLPKMKEYYNGEANSSKLDIHRMTIVLRHHQGNQHKPTADVFVHTFYPRST